MRINQNIKFNLNDFIHISIDDVIDSFIWIYRNKPNSVFDEPLFFSLLKWHMEYQLTFDLYIFERNEHFDLSKLQKKYWDELKNNTSWLKIGWHQICPGEIVESVNKQLDSAKRVYDLLCEKCSMRILSKSLRLHMFEGNPGLMDFLNRVGVKCFLTADAQDRRSYDLSEQEIIVLNEKRWYKREKTDYIYRTTDLRLDGFAENITVSDAILKTEDFYNKYPTQKRIEVFFHEWKFPQISEKIDEFLKGVLKIKRDIYINAATVISDKVVCSIININSICCLKFNTELTVEADNTYLKNNSGMKFASLDIQDDELWLTPWCEKNITLYSFKYRRMVVYPLPYSEDCVFNSHRKSILYDYFLWLLPSHHRELVRINMGTREAELFSCFPKGISFSEPRSMMFKNMELYGDNIYLYSDSCSHNITLNPKTGEMVIWNNDFQGTFGIHVDERYVLLAPIKDGEALRIYDSVDKEFEYIELPDDIWQGAKIYAYWYMKRIGDAIYIFPHEANAILKFDIRNKSVKPIYTTSYKFKTLRPNEGFSCYDVFEMNDELWFIPYMGNQILRVKDDAIQGLIALKLPLYTFAPDYHLNPGVVREREGNSIERFVDGLLSTKQVEGVWANQEVNLLYKVQKRLLQMAFEIEQILDKHNIHHSIMNGSLLGAVRHEGFIPWDDDFDFCIFNEAYEEAIKVLREELPKELFLEDEQSEPMYFHAWAHVKDLETEAECDQYMQDNWYAHHGLSIDLYRIEKVKVKDIPVRAEEEYINYISRRKKLGLMEDEEVEARLSKISDGASGFWNDKMKKESAETVNREVFASVYTGKNYYEIEDFLPLKKYKFDEYEFWGPNNADAVLTKGYGDYMVLPPKEKRIPHYSKVEFLK